RRAGELWGIGEALKPIGEPSAGDGSGAGGGGRVVRGEVGGDGGGVARYSQSRRRLSAAGPQLSGRAAAIHVGGCVGAGGGGARIVVGGAAILSRRDRVVGPGLGIDRDAAGKRSERRSDGGESGLCDLHLRIDGKAERSRCRPSQCHAADQRYCRYL